MQVGGPSSFLTPMSMQRSWLNDVSPPSSICTSMDFQNCGNMLNSLITSSDFTNVSFLLNGSDGGDETRKQNGTITLEHVTPTKSFTRNLMDFTFDVNKTISVPSNATFTADVGSPLKEFGVDNADIQLTDSTEDVGKNLTYNAHENGGNLTWDKIQEHQNELNKTIIQSTPVHVKEVVDIFKKNFDHTMSPISSLRSANDGDEEAGVVIRNNRKSRNIISSIMVDDYRDSMEDQCEFLLNEETIKLSSRVCGDSFDCHDLKAALINSADSNEREFDKMLDSFNVKKSLESEKLLQSVDNIKQRHSLINLEKQREEKQRNENDNKTQYDSMNKSSERLLRRSRLYDDVNLQLQKQQMETSDGAKLSDVEQPEEAEEVVDRSNRDRFKTIKLNKKLQSGMVVVEPEPAELAGDGKSTSPGTNKELRNQMNQRKQDNVETDFKKPAPAPSKLSKFGFSRPTYRSRNDLNLPLKANSTDSLDNDEPRMSNVGPKLKSPMGVKSKSIHNLMFGGSAHNGNRAGSYSNLKLISGATRSQSNLKAPRASSLVRPTADHGFKVRNLIIFQNNLMVACAKYFYMYQNFFFFLSTNFMNFSIKTSISTLSGAYCNSLQPSIISSASTDQSKDFAGSPIIRILPERLQHQTTRFRQRIGLCKLPTSLPAVFYLIFFHFQQSLSSSSASSRNSVAADQQQQIYHQNSIHSQEELNQISKKTISTTGTNPKQSGLRMPQARSGLPRPSGLASRKFYG